MGFWDLFLLTILSIASLNAVSGKTVRKIAPFSVEEVGGNGLIPEFPEKHSLGRRLLEGEAVEMTTDVSSTDQDETKPKQGNEVRAEVNKEVIEVPQESKANEMKVEETVPQHEDDTKNVRVEDERDNENKTNITAVHQEDNKLGVAMSETSGSSDEKQGTSNQNDKKEPGITNIDNTGSGSGSPEIMLKNEMPKEGQNNDEEKDSSEINQEKVVADGKETAGAKTNDSQITEKDEQQSSDLHQNPDAKEGEEASVHEKEENAQQNEAHNATNGDNAEKTVEVSETTVAGEKEQEGLAAEQDQNLRNETLNETLKNRLGDNISDKLEQEKSEPEIQQEESEIDENKIAVEMSDATLSDGEPIENLKEEVNKMKQEEEENEGLNERTESDKLESAEGDLKEQENKMTQPNEEKDLVDSGQHKEESDKEAKEVESQAEDVSADTTVDLDVSSVHGSLSRQPEDPVDEDYGDLVQEFADLPSKFHGTAEKVAEHLAPDFLKWSDTSKNYFNIANQHIAESFSPLVGRQYAPFLASVVSYALLFLPLIVVAIFFEHFRALFSLQKILLFIHIYLAAYFSTLILASLAIGSEPMSFFYKNSLSSYIYLQLLQALGYLVYLVLQTFNIIISCSSDTFAAKLTSVLQWVVAVLVGLHYYVTVFQRAMASKAPRTSWKIYGIYSVAFFILCLFARIRRLKKHYVHAGDGSTDKKN